MPLWITVFEHAVEVALGPVLQTGQVAIGAGSLQSAAIVGSGGKSRRVRLFADADCHVAWGASPTATTDDFPLEANSAEYVSVVAGDLIAVIQRV